MYKHDEVQMLINDITYRNFQVLLAKLYTEATPMNKVVMMALHTSPHLSFVLIKEKFQITATIFLFNRLGLTWAKRKDINGWI